MLFGAYGGALAVGRAAAGCEGAAEARAAGGLPRADPLTPQAGVVEGAWKRSTARRARLEVRVASPSEIDGEGLRSEVNTTGGPSSFP